MRAVTIYLLLTAATAAQAQVPVIIKVEPETIYPGGKVVITGSGFSGTSSQLSVWFDNVRATVVSSSEFSIEATVPVNARHGNVEVINLSSKLSAKSEVKFSPSYNGESLTTANAASKFTLLPASVTTHPSEILDVCTCDFNLDGKPDLAGSVPDNLGNVVKLATNTSAGPGSLSFTSANLTMNFPTTNLACGDLNGDGKPDLVATRGGANSNEVLIKTNTIATPGGAIAFSAGLLQLSIDPTDRAYRIVIHDVDKDGKPDLVVTNANNSTATPPANNVYVFRNTTNISGTISFAPPVKVAVAGAVSTYGLEVQDLDGDRKPELIVNQFNAADIFVVKNNSTSGQVTFGTAQRIAIAGSVFNHLVTADFNKDGKYDIAVTNGSNANLAHVLLNTSSGSTFSFSTLGPFPTGDGAWGIDAGDLDGDGDIDVVVGDQDFLISATPDTEITLLINNGAFPNINFNAVNVNKGKKSRNIEIADFDQDGKMDIAFTSAQGGNSVEVLRNTNCFVPKILNEAPLTICTPQTILLESIPNPGAAFQWEKDAADIAGQTTPNTSISASGGYSVRATSEGGSCVKETPDFVVSPNASAPPATPTITSGTGGVLTVCPNGTANLTTSNTGVTYAWTGPNGFTSTAQNPQINNVSTAQAGLYTLQLSNGACKSDEATVRLDVASLESFSITSSSASNTVCQGGNVTLSTVSQSGNTYQWVRDGSDLTGQTANTLAATAEGAYKVRVTTSLGCSVETDALSIRVFVLPVAAFSAPATGCKDQPVTFTNESVLDSRGQAVYSWNLGNSQSSTVASPTPSYTAAGTFSVTLTASYAGLAGCSDTETKSITITTPASIAITASDTGVCPGQPITLSVPTSGFTGISWSSGQTTAAIEVTAANTYTVRANDANNCTATASVVVAAKNVPVITISTDPNPASVPPGTPVQLFASGADVYAWTPEGSLSSATVPNPTATPTETTEYTVVGSLNGGCSAEAKITVEVAGELRITNVFSPNGDGINDFWVIPGINNYVDCTLTLFDANGRKIFEQRGYQNDWDGTYNGKQVPKGTYYYVIGGCPDRAPVNGHVLVAY